MRATRTAQGQGRCLTIEQLSGHGISPDSVSRAARAGHVTRVHRRVYVLGPPRLTPEERLWAAYLAGGPRALASFNSARGLLGIRDWTGAPHVTTPTQKRPLRGAFLHVGTIPVHHTTARRGLRCTGAARTLADCALVSPPEVLLDDIDMAIGMELVTFEALEDAGRTMPGHHGLGRLGAALAVIADDPGAGRTNGEMELLFKRHLREIAGLPRYLRNHRITLPDGRVVVPDVYFPDERVWLELDSRRWHEQRRAMDSDRRKDQRAVAWGYIPFRITWRHLIREWAPVRADLLATLEGRRRPAA